MRGRLGAYYTTPLGARTPHAGGWWLKVLTTAAREGLQVHYAETSDPGTAEDEMLRTYCAGVSKATLSILRDPARPFPFANLEWPKGVRKAHGITGATGELRKAVPPEGHIL